MTRPTEFLLRIAELLEELAIPYHVGGSVASSAHGMYRASADIDFVIDPTAEQLEALATRLDGEFYVSRSAIAEALAERGKFNAIHEATSFKIDFFLKGHAPFDAEELRGSIRLAIGDGAGRTVLIKSPEDTMLRKLDWFRRGGEASERQWNDVLAMLTAGRGRFDEAHLDHWADELGVSHMLERARRQVAEP